MEKIKIENLTFSYPEKNRNALDSINLEVKQGDFVVLCGKSGCGKSTLLRHLKPLLAPYGNKSGCIYLDGKEISELSQREQAEKIGFVMQSPDNQIVCDKVWHELSFGLESLSLPSDEIRVRIAEMASFFGIQDWYYKNTCELSGGQKQLLNLASVMVMQPSVIILDEPTSRLDPIAAHDFLDTLSKINKDLGTTIILSEHRLEKALPLADTVIVMDSGKILACGSACEIGQKLKAYNHSMLLALPTPMRVYYSLGNGGACPVTVREGRQWLSNINPDLEVQFNDTPHSRNHNAALTIENAWFRYEKNSADVLKGLSLTVNQGELYAIVGGNGSGKSTLLSAITGINKPYSGKIKSANDIKIAALPQNPQNLFVKNTVLLDLYEAESSDKQKVDNIISFCELKDLLDSHPYDLSGGEQQRCALAKVLLCEPDILLLDEPTKGLDAHFKQKLAGMLKMLQKNNITIVMVSHDIEFCARYADRLGMLFDGNILSEGTPRTFFAGKNFYTTAANRMARHLRSDAMLDEDIISMIGGKQYDEKDISSDTPKSGQQETPPQPLPAPPPAGLSKRTKLAAWTSFLLIPITILLGSCLFGSRRYYFTGLLVLLEAMLPFAIMLEGRRPKVRELVLISALCSIAVVGRIAFMMLPQFKPVTALVIISGICLGSETGFLVGAITGFVSNFYFSQGPWTPWQMFAFGVIGFLSGLLAKNTYFRKNKFAVCIFGFLSCIVIYGGITNPASVLITQDNITADMMFASFAAGFPLDVIHGASTVFFLWLALVPMCEKLERIKLKYGLISKY